MPQGGALQGILLGEKRKLPVDTERCSLLIAKFPKDPVILLLSSFSLVFLAWNHLDPGNQAIRVRNHEMALWVVRGTTPVHSTHVARKYDGALLTRRCEDTFQRNTLICPGTTCCPQESAPRHR